MDADPSENNKRKIFNFFSLNISVILLSSLEKKKKKKPSDIIPACLSVFGDQPLFKCQQRRTNPTITQQVNFCFLIVLCYGPRRLCTMYGYKLEVVDAITSVI